MRHADGQGPDQGTPDQTPDAGNDSTALGRLEALQQQNRQLVQNYGNLQPEYTRATQENARLKQEQQATQARLAEAEARLVSAQDDPDIDPDDVDVGAMAKEVIRLGRELDERDTTIGALKERQGLHERGLKLALQKDQAAERTTVDQTLTQKIRAQFGDLGPQAEGAVLDAWKSRDPERIAQVSHMARDAAYEKAITETANQADGQASVGGANGVSGGGGSTQAVEVDAELLKQKYPDPRERQRAAMMIGLGMEAPPTS